MKEEEKGSVRNSGSTWIVGGDEDLLLGMKARREEERGKSGEDWVRVSRTRGAACPDEEAVKRQVDSCREEKRVVAANLQPKHSLDDEESLFPLLSIILAVKRQAVERLESSALHSLDSRYRKSH